MTAAGGSRKVFVLAMMGLMWGCGSSDGTDTSGVTETPPDLRFDSSTWPESITDGDRTAAVYGPQDYDGESLLPVIMLLHGYGASGILQDLVYQLRPRVDTEGFILILPEGTTDSRGLQFWNATEACCDFDGTEIDDVGHLLTVLDGVEAAYPVDTKRISVTGHSNGGYMSYRMGCEASDRIAAIAPLAGLAFGNEADCAASEAVSVLHTHGTEDADVPYDGFPPFLPGAQQSVERWTSRAGCSGTTQDLGTADYETSVDGEEATRIQWSDGCEAGFNAELWTLNGVGHLPFFTELWRDEHTAWLLSQSR